LPKGLAQLAVDDAWVAGIVGRALYRWEDDGIGPCVGIGAKLPSGTAIELVRHDMGGPLYSVYVDGSANLRDALVEFLSITGLDPSAVRWRSPEA
jgi:hypothetical protein